MGLPSTETSLPLRLPPIHTSLPSLFCSTLCTHALSYPSRLCHDSCAKNHPHLLFHVSHRHPVTSTSKVLFSQWQQFFAASSAATNPRPLRTEKPRPVPAPAPNPLQHRLPTTSTRRPLGACHRARASHSAKINARMATIPLRYHHRPSDIPPMIHVIHTNIAAHPSIGPRATTSQIPIIIIMVREIFLFTLDPYQFSSEAHIPARGIFTGRFVAQFPQGGYVTPGSSRSNSTSSLYPGPVHGTPFVPSPLIPSPPRSKASDDLPSKTPAAQNKAWQAAGVSTSASGSSTCTCFLPSLPPFEPELNFSLFSHTIHRWPGTITLTIPGPRTPLPHAPPPLLHPATSRAHLLRRSIHTLRTHSRRSYPALSLPSSNTSPARDRASDPSELPSRSAIPKTPLGRRRRSDRRPAVILHRERRREAQDEKLSCAHEPRRALCRALHSHDLRHARGVAFARRGLAGAAPCRGSLQGAVYAHGRWLGGRCEEGGLARI